MIHPIRNEHQRGKAALAARARRRKIKNTALLVGSTLIASSLFFGSLGLSERQEFVAAMIVVGILTAFAAVQAWRLQP